MRSSTCWTASGAARRWPTRVRSASSTSRPTPRWPLVGGPGRRPAGQRRDDGQRAGGGAPGGAGRRGRGDRAPARSTARRSACRSTSPRCCGRRTRTRCRRRHATCWRASTRTPTGCVSCGCARSTRPGRASRTTTWWERSRDRWPRPRRPGGRRGAHREPRRRTRLHGRAGHRSRVRGGADVPARRLQRLLRPLGDSVREIVEHAAGRGSGRDPPRGRSARVRAHDVPEVRGSAERARRGERVGAGDPAGADRGRRARLLARAGVDLEEAAHVALLAVAGAGLARSARHPRCGAVRGSPRVRSCGRPARRRRRRARSASLRASLGGLRGRRRSPARRRPSPRARSRGRTRGSARASAPSLRRRARGRGSRASSDP